MSIRRSNIDRTPGTSAMVREVPYINVSTNVHPKTSIIENQIYEKRKQHFPQKKLVPVQEYLTIPFPDFCTIFYEITIWTQYQSHMNEILEKIFYNYDYLDSFVMFTKYDEKKKGHGYRLVGYREGNVTPQDNASDFSNQERLIKYTYNIRVPTALILNPKDETLAYGRKKGDSKTDDNSKIVFKSQNVIDVKLKEEIVSAEVLEVLENPNRTEEERRSFTNVLNQYTAGTASPTFDTAIPEPVGVVGSVGNSGRLPQSNHVHAHGEQSAGNMHATVSTTGSGFAPTLSGITDGYALLKTGTSASWGPVASSGGSTTIINGFTGSVSLVAGPNISIASSSNGSIAISGTVQNTQVTGSDNFFVNQVLTVSGTAVNPTGHLILSSGLGYVVVSGSLQVLDPSSIMTRGKVYNDSGHLLLSSSTGVVNFSSSVEFSDLNKVSHLTAKNGHLILSSSAGSIVTSSGSMRVRGNLNVAGPLNSVAVNITSDGQSAISVVGSNTGGFSSLHTVLINGASSTNGHAINVTAGGAGRICH